MNCRISTTEIFERSLKRLAKRYKSIKDDFATLLKSLHENPLQGVDLGSGLHKVRMSISAKGKGKRGGARVITYKIFQEEDDIEIRLVDIYDKSQCESLSDKEIQTILKKSGLK